MQVSFLMFKFCYYISGISKDIFLNFQIDFSSGKLRVERECHVRCRELKKSICMPAWLTVCVITNQNEIKRIATKVIITIIGMCGDNEGQKKQIVISMQLR